MQQKAKKSNDDQVLYQGRWVDKSSFRVFVYNEKGDEKLAPSYPEFESLIASGIWFASKPDASRRMEKKKDVAIPNSK
jgi:hypothetical protein